MTVAQICGIALAIAGVVFLIAGINATDAPTEQLSEAFTGRYTQQTLWYIAGGLGALIGGGFLFLSRR
jgi:LPXTG-motif cell wall-anchored protein